MKSRNYSDMKHWDFDYLVILKQTYNSSLTLYYYYYHNLVSPHCMIVAVIVTKFLVAYKSPQEFPEISKNFLNSPRITVNLNP